MSILDDVINVASVKEMLAYYGVEKRGEKYLCPFHNDRNNPSMTVTADDKRWSCHTCGEGGNIDNLVQKMERMRGNSELGEDGIEAYKKRMDFIIKTQSLPVQFSLNQPKQRMLTPEEKKRVQDIGILRNAMVLAENCLENDKQHKGQASRYLASRGISDATIRAFGIGYDENTFIYDNLSAKYDDYALYNVGVISKDKRVEGKYYDAQKDRVLIPIKNANGEVVGFGGRSLQANPMVKYLNTRATDYFKKREILFNFDKCKRDTEAQEEIVIVEGYFDVVSAYELGLRNTVGLMGVELTTEHKELLSTLGKDGKKPVITLCLDNDDAGRKAMCKIIPSLVKEGYDVYVVDTQALDKGKDMNDFLCNGVTKEDLLNKKIPAITFLVQYGFQILEHKGNIGANEIKQIYDTVFKYPQFCNSYNEVLFEEYVTSHYSLQLEQVRMVCHPFEEATLVNTAMENYFCNLIKKQALLYAEKTNNRVLSQFLEQKRFNKEHILKGLNSPDFIENNGCKINVVKYCEEYLLNTQDYKSFSKTFDEHFNTLLDNVYSMDKTGQMVRVYLTPKQKDIVQKQYLETLPEDTREYVSENKELFTKLFIADNVNEYVAMLGEDYPYDDKEYGVECFNKGEMVFINYAVKPSLKDIDIVHQMYGGEYTTADGDDWQKVFVYNNSFGELCLQPDNYKAPVQNLPQDEKGVYEEYGDVDKVVSNSMRYPQSQGNRGRAGDFEERIHQGQGMFNAMQQVQARPQKKTDKSRPE